MLTIATLRAKLLVLQTKLTAKEAYDDIADRIDEMREEFTSSKSSIEHSRREEIKDKLQSMSNKIRSGAEDAKDAFDTFVASFTSEK